MIKIEFDWDFFIAHTGADKTGAEALYLLMAREANVFVDFKCLRPGDDWDVELMRALKKSRITVVLISLHTEKAYYEREEVAAAIAMAREDPERYRVVPVYLDAQNGASYEVPYGLRLKHSLRVGVDGDLSNIAAKLIHLVSESGPWVGQPTKTSTQIVQPLPLRTASTQLRGRDLDARSQSEITYDYIESLGVAIDFIEPAQLGGEGPARALELKKLYTCLVADPTSFEEHQKARELETQLAISKFSLAGQWRDALIPSPSGTVKRVMEGEIPGESKSTGSGHANNDTEPIQALGETLHRVVRAERCCVILGDPGSGKSVLCRWLTRELALCWRDGIRSPELGPPRAPFLVILPKLADAIASGQTQSVTDFLMSSLRPEPCLPEEWEQYVRQILKHGKAFLIFDGLDEVPRDQMRIVRQMIETFTNEDIVTTAKRLRPDSGVGNQIIVTSRILGYYRTALPSSSFSHFLIRPMADNQIEEFCRHWCEALGYPKSTNSLLSEIFDDRRPGIRSMARNPLLLSILCQLGTKNPKKKVELPQIRAELYEKVIRETTETWRNEAHTSLREEEPYFAQLLSGADNILAFFAPVAAHIHATSVTSEIEAPDLRRWLVRSMAWFDGKEDYKLTLNERSRRERFLMKAIESVVGVLSERSQGRFQFLHRTFQEYLAGVSLLLTDATNHVPGGPVFGVSATALADRIVVGGYLQDPLWRQPLLLLCGQLAWMEQCNQTGGQRIAPHLSDLIKELDSKQTSEQTGLLQEQWVLFLSDVLSEVPDSMLMDQLK